MNAHVTLTDWPAVVNPGGQQRLPAPVAVDVFGLDLFDFQVQILAVGTGATHLYIDGSMQNQLDDDTLWTILWDSGTPTVTSSSAHIPGTAGGAGPFRYLRWRLAGSLSGNAYVFFIRGVGRAY